MKTGTTQGTNLCMDGAKVVGDFKEDCLDSILNGIDEAILADQSNDPDQSAGLSELEQALAMAKAQNVHVDLMSHLLKAQRHFKTAFAKDLGDHTKEALRAHIMAYRDRAEKAEADLKQLTGQISKARKEKAA